MTQIPVVPGIVTQADPLLVRLEGVDEDGQPCQAVAAAAVGDRGGVLASGGQRVWLGRYGTEDMAADAVDRVRQAVEALQGVQDITNETYTQVVDVIEDVESVRDEVNDAVLLAASATGFDVWPDDEPLPTTRRNGSPLSHGDGLYLVDHDANITGVLIWAETPPGWIPFAFAAEHILATGSIVGDLIAAGTEITAPIITGGVITGAVLRTAETGRRIELQGMYLRSYDSSGNYASLSEAGLRFDNGATVSTTGGGLRLSGSTSGGGVISIGPEIVLLPGSDANGVRIGGATSTTTPLAVKGPVSAVSATTSGSLSVGGNATVSGTVNGVTISKGSWSAGITLESGVTGTVQYRVVNGVCYLRGIASLVSGSFTSSYRTLGWLPVSTSTTRTYIAPAFDPVMAAQVSITSNGTMSVRTGATGATAIDLSSISFPLD